MVRQVKMWGKIFEYALILGSQSGRGSEWNWDIETAQLSLNYRLQEEPSTTKEVEENSFLTGILKIWEVQTTIAQLQYNMHELLSLLHTMK